MVRRWVLDDVSIDIVFCRFALLAVAPRSGPLPGCSGLVCAVMICAMVIGAVDNVKAAVAVKVAVKSIALASAQHL
jgi:hypothetical protein